MELNTRNDSSSTLIFFFNKREFNYKLRLNLTRFWRAKGKNNFVWIESRGRLQSEYTKKKSRNLSNNALKQTFPNRQVYRAVCDGPYEAKS